MEFVIGVLSSLVAGVILVLGTGVLSVKGRRVLTATLGSLLNIDIEYVFRDKDDAVTDYVEEMKRASFICLLTSRGSELQREPFSSALAAGNVRILLPNPNYTECGADWTTQREQEMVKFDETYGNNLLHSQINTVIKFLAQSVRKNKTQLKLYNSPHIGRILITDNVVYFTPYSSDSHGSKSCVIKYRRGQMYDSYLRFFNQLWLYGSSEYKPTELP